MKEIKNSANNCGEMLANTCNQTKQITHGAHLQVHYDINHRLPKFIVRHWTELGVLYSWGAEWPPSRCGTGEGLRSGTTWPSPPHPEWQVCVWLQHLAEAQLPSAVGPQALHLCLTRRKSSNWRQHLGYKNPGQHQKLPKSLKANMRCCCGPEEPKGPGQSNVMLCVPWGP